MELLKSIEHAAGNCIKYTKPIKRKGVGRKFPQGGG